MSSVQRCVCCYFHLDARQARLQAWWDSKHGPSRQLFPCHALPARYRSLFLEELVCNEDRHEFARWLKKLGLRSVLVYMCCAAVDARPRRHPSGVVLGYDIEEREISHELVRFIFTTE